MGVTLLVSAVCWLIVAALHGLSQYSDLLRRGGSVPPALWPIVAGLVPAYLPWALFTAALYWLAWRRRERVTRPLTLAQWFAGSVLVFYLPEVVYQVALVVSAPGAPGTVGAAFWPALRAWPALYWLIDFGLLVTTFAAVVGLVALRHGRHAERRRQRLRTENLQLRLQLEQQRLAALRAQLEPHFLFNALNAISGLVRGDQRGGALTAMQQLSGLLRYALSASGQPWVTLGDELTFVRGYVALQTLRFGDRLRFGVDGDDPDVLSIECAPLLLQPLIENAVRHSLEAHDTDDAVADVRLSLGRDQGRVTVRVRNTVAPDAADNPGTGLGLTATRDRLALLYNGRAHCRTTCVDGEFIVALSFPEACA